MQDWISDIKKLSIIAESQSHAAYSAYCHGLSFRWNYFFRVCTSSSLFQPLEDCICSDLILKLLGRDIPGKVEQDLFSLPVRLGGLGLFIPTVTAVRQHTCSLHASSPLIDLIVSQAHNVAYCLVNQVQLCSEVHATQRKELEEFAKNIYDQLPPDLLSSAELACEKGASNWLSCLPLKFYGFALHKTAFRDAVML